MGVESSIEHPTPILTFPLPGGRDRIFAYPCLQLRARNLSLQRIAAQDNGKPQLVSQLARVCSFQRPTNFPEDPEGEGRGEGGSRLIPQHFAVST